MNEKKEMITLIAESKTMQPVERDVSPSYLASHTPEGERYAQEIMDGIKTLTLNELIEQTGLTSSLALKLQKSAYEFSFKASGNPAIEAYTGVVFKFLDYPSLSDDTKRRCDERVRIISSLYGWLRPEDIIKTYRLDFTTKFETGPSADRSLNSFWRQEVTKCLVRDIRDSGQTEVLNLLPGDAAKCIDWKLVKRFTKVWKVDFVEVKEGDKMKTPAANRLKTLRGYLLRQILEEDIQNCESLIHTVSHHYVCEGTPVYPDHLQFLC